MSESNADFIPSTLAHRLRMEFCAGQPEQRAKAVKIAMVNPDKLAEWLLLTFEMKEAGGSYCLCSDPDYCLNFSTPQYRARAIAYRRTHGAPLPKDSNDGSSP